MWWEEMGYPLQDPSHKFESGKDGFPRIGQVVKFYREGEGMTQNTVAKKLGIERRQMKRIENEDASVDIDRRRTLCNLLGIPPVLLGIVTPKEIARIIEQKVNGTGPIDIGGHQDFLTKAHDLHHQSTATLLLDITQLKLNGLCCQFFGGGSNILEHKKIYKLIFSYHILLGLQLRELQKYDEALAHIAIAGDYAKFLDNEELKTIHHLHYIRVFDAVGNVQEAVSSFDVNRLRKASAPLASMGYAYVSTLYARAATTATERKEARTLLRYAEPFVHSHPDLIDIHGLDCSLWGYHVREAHTLIGVGEPNAALCTLRYMEQPTPGSWGNAYQLQYEARAHTELGNLGVATLCAEECLKIALKFKSPMNVARVQVIRNDIVKRGYNSKDLVELDRMLLKG